jgi:hypothetical protein
LAPAPAPEILPGLFGVAESLKFDSAVADVGQNLAQVDLDTRTKMRDGLIRKLADRTPQGLPSQLTPMELSSMASFGLALADPQADGRAFADLLIDIREAAILARSSLAIVLGDLSPATAGVDVLPGLAGHPNDFMLVENNRITGAICLMGMPEGVLAQDKIGPLTTSLRAGPGNLPPLRLLGLSGTLQFRGNQVGRMVVSQPVVDQIMKAFVANAGVFSGTVSGLLGRCAVAENVIAGAGNLIVSQQLLMASNRISLMAFPVALSTGPVSFIAPLLTGASVADNAVFVGNQGREPRALWQNASRVSDKAANVELNIS